MSLAMQYQQSTELVHGVLEEMGAGDLGLGGRGVLHCFV